MGKFRVGAAILLGLGLRGHRQGSRRDCGQNRRRSQGVVAGGSRVSVRRDDLVGARLRIGDGSESNAWVAVAGGGDVFHDAILLRDEGDTLLLEQGLFKEPLECHLSFEKKWHRVRLEGVLENGLDYERVALSFLDAPRV